MESSLLQSALEWVATHPTLSGITVFLIAFSESVAIVGLFMPGAVLMFGVGTLVGTGVLDLYTTLAWAFAGAVVGDGISYGIGRYYQDRLRAVWPLRNHPQWLAPGEKFFERHGGKSIVFGRFVGPVRPVLPLVAGMLNMPAPRYVTINLLSALAWAPAYILPGVVFGTSLELASEVAGRLVILLLVLLTLLVSTTWLVKHTFQFLQPRASRVISRLLSWSDRHPVLGQVTAALVDPHHPEGRGLLVLALVLVGAAWLFLLISGSVTGDTPFVELDRRILQISESLRVPWADQFMVAVTELGDATVLGGVCITVLVWLLWRRHRHGSAHLAAAGAFAGLAPLVLKHVLAVPRPPGANLEDFSFPSGHTTASMVVYGFLAVMLGREMRPPLRWVPYVTAGCIIVFIAVSRVYLGVHWLSDALGGLSLGLAWVALLGIAYRRHPAPRIPLRAFGVVVLGALSLAGGWHIASRLPADLERYAYHRPATPLNETEWWQGNGGMLPAFRIDLEQRPRHPLTLQWNRRLDAVRDLLQHRGWQTAPPFDMTAPMRWLNPEASIDQLPVLPQVHDGRHEALVMVRPETPARRMVLRLWRSRHRLVPGQEPLWIGNVSYQERDSSLPLFTVARTVADYITPFQHFAAEISGAEIRRVPSGGKIPPPGRLLLR